MKIVILAAGTGSRLSNGEELPKCLTPLSDGKSILEHQISQFKKLVPSKNIIIVVGYQKEEIIQHYPDCIFVESANFANENTAKSLEKSLPAVDDDLLWINGDVLFHPTVLEQVVAFKQNCMVVIEKQVGDEEVKYRTDGEGNITAVSKEVKEAQGEAVGINFFTKEAIPLLWKHLKECHPQDYFEKAIEGCISEGLEVKALPTSPDTCIEIDFPEDLTKANTLLDLW